jgi:hypothetical protein
MFRTYLYALGMKKPCFSEELEWRILAVSPDQKGVKLHRARGKIIPYVELSDIPQNVFASVTLGSEVESNNEAELLEFLQCNQLQHVKVRRSRISRSPLT